jgi:GNAT superfamily N-acetyltransferase
MTLDDIGELVARIRDAGNESGWSKGLQFDSGHVADQLAMMIINDDFLVIGTDDVGAVMIASVRENWYTPSLQANELILYAHPEVRRSGRANDLVNEFVRWAKDKGAKKINAGVSLGIHPEACCNLYESLGFERTGFLFSQEV